MMTIAQIYDENGSGHPVDKNSVWSVKMIQTKFFEPSNTLMCNFTAFVRTAKTLHINHEVDRCKWFTPQEARENIRPPQP